MCVSQMCKLNLWKVGRKISLQSTLEAITKWEQL